MKILIELIGPEGDVIQSEGGCKILQNKEQALERLVKDNRRYLCRKIDVKNFRGMFLDSEHYNMLTTYTNTPIGAVYISIQSVINFPEKPK